jgi:PAS domain S-box-containing protein
MAKPMSESLKTRLTIGRIVFIYFLVGATWIIASSLWLSNQNDDAALIIMIEALKGLGYVVVTTILLWFLCRSWSRQVTKALEKYELSQSQYELYVRNSPIAISVIDQRGNFLETNAATEELTGYNAEELKKINIFNLIAGSDLEDTQKAFADIFLIGRATRDRTIICKNGMEKIIRVDGVRHTEGQAICFSRDITDRKLSEEKLLRLNSMLRAIRRVNKAIVGTPDIDDLIRKICEILVEDREFKHAWIALLDEDGTPLHYHDAPKVKDTEKLQRFLQTQQLPKCLEKTKTEDGLILATDPVNQCPGFPIMDGLKDCALLGVEFSYDHNVGYIALMASHAAVEDKEEIGLFREVAEDLRFALQGIIAEAERKQATEDLILAKQTAESANRAKDEFLSVMSHEMRTPLNPIMGHTGLLMEEIEDPEQLKCLEQINQSSEKLLSLIDDILYFSQLQDQSTANRSASFKLLNCCQETLEVSRERYPNKTITFVNGTDDYTAIDETTRVAADQEYIRRVVSELLCNACKYSHEGEIHLRVGQRGLGSGRLEVLFEVEDSGIGIKEDILEKLFHPFTQVDSSHTRRYEGIGLGLATCRKIADILGGSLTAKSRPGVGSCFRFLCPLDPVKPPPPREQPPQSSAAVDSSVSTGKVLLVEDSPSNAIVAQTMLRRWGLWVDLAEDGQVAVEKCKQQSYDLILMDLSMPVMNGFEATREIRSADSANRKTPILGLTAHVSSEVEEDCRKADMDGFIAKPIRLQTFRERIAQHVQIV